MKTEYLWHWMMAAILLLPFRLHAGELRPLEIPPDVEMQFQRLPVKARIMYPMSGNYRLDACYVGVGWGLTMKVHCEPDVKRHNADEFCRRHGYAKADSWEIEPIDSSATYTGLVCQENCYGFVYIVCTHY